MGPLAQNAARPASALYLSEVRFSFRPTLGLCVHVADGLLVDAGCRDPTVMTVQMTSAERRAVAERVLASAFDTQEQGWFEIALDDCRARVGEALRELSGPVRDSAAADWAEVFEYLGEVERRTGEPGMLSITW